MSVFREFFRIERNWKQGFYLLPLTFWVYVVAPNALRFPGMVSMNLGLSYTLLFWPFAVALVLLIVWPSRFTWWITTIIWLFLAWSSAHADFLRAINNEGIKWATGARWMTIPISLFIFGIPLLLHWLLGPRVRLMNRTLKSSHGQKSN